MNIKITEKIIKILRVAGSIKDRIEPICNKSLRWYGKKKGYAMCVKCYGNSEKIDKTDQSSLDSNSLYNEKVLK